MYKVTATGKQCLPKQAIWLRIKAEQSNGNVKWTVECKCAHGTVPAYRIRIHIPE